MGGLQSCWNRGGTADSEASAIDGKKKQYSWDQRRSDDNNAKLDPSKFILENLKDGAVDGRKPGEINGKALINIMLNHLIIMFNT
jgi:hypothetical protein